MSYFYRQFGLYLAIAVVLALPILTSQADSLQTNNDIETWLPRTSAAKDDYDSFKNLFGAEEAILIGLPTTLADPQLMEAIASRIESLNGIRSCWSPARFKTVMGQLGVDQSTATERLRGLVLARDHQTEGLIAILSPEGLQQREQVVHEVEEILAYSQLSEKDVLLSGAPVIVAKLNQLGSRESSQLLFIITLLICFALLIHSTRHWRLSLSILVITIFAIQLTLCGVKWWSGEMNFILSALPVMVMVFTMATAIHLLHYYESCSDQSDRLSSALKKAWRPCLLATFTTAIGLVSLTVSEIVPVQQFGLAAAFGAIVSTACGLGLTPVALTMWPDAVKPHVADPHDWGTRFSFAVIRNRRPIVISVCLMLLVSLSGLVYLDSKVEPLDFLPRESDVVADYIQIEKSLTNVDSFEAVVDFGTQNISFVEKLRRVQKIEHQIAAHDGVQHTMSLGTFFPDQLPENGLELIKTLSAARSSGEGRDYVSAGERFWRISARIQGNSTDERQLIFQDLQKSLQGQPVMLTGVAPLIKQAQDDIFAGFWESFGTALIIICLVMIVALRSLPSALLAMIPNITPLCLVFGALGWIRFPVDIGMMMTASIALGIAVDGTFHFLVAFRDRCRASSRSDRNALVALLNTGKPIFEAAMIASIGMLALTQSHFIPTVRFGLLMSVLLATAVFADLIVLPALLSTSTNRKRKRRSSAQRESGLGKDRSRIAA